MSVFDDTEIIWGAPGIPGTGLTAGEKTTINTRLTDLEAATAALPDSIDDMTDVNLTGIASGDLLQWDGTGLVKVSPTITVPFAIPVIVDGGSSAPTVGVKGVIRPKFSCTITGWDIYNRESGSIEWDIRSGGVSIVGTVKPATSSAFSNSSTDMTGWTTAITPSMALEFRILSASTVTESSFNLFLTRTLTVGS